MLRNAYLDTKLETGLTTPSIDFEALRSYRLTRLRSGMAAGQIDLAIITNPLSMRYAIDYWNYPLFLARIPSTILIIPIEGPIAISGAFLTHDDGIDIELPMFNLSPFDGGLDNADEARRFVTTIKSFLSDHIKTDKQIVRIGVDRMDAQVFNAFTEAGIQCFDIIGIVEEAKSIKSEEEIGLIRHSIAVAEQGISLMREKLSPGVSERELWSWLHQTNIANGGFWTDGNMLASGERTNPWLQNVSARKIENGEMVAFDTDMVGPYCYFADISRSWICGDAKPNRRQQALFQRAFDEVSTNLELIKPGVTFRELSTKSFRQPEKYHARRYPCVVHGVGMCDEYPKIPYPQDWEKCGYDGVIQTGMVLCIESYVGAVGEPDGVKLEEQVLVTDSGYEKLSTYPINLDFTL